MKVERKHNHIQVQMVRLKKDLNVISVKSMDIVKTVIITADNARDVLIIYMKNVEIQLNVKMDMNVI